MPKKAAQNEATPRQKRDEPPPRPCADPECRCWVVPGRKCGLCGKQQPAVTQPEVVADGEAER